MSILLKLHQAGQPVLRKKSTPLSREQLLKKETQDLIDFMIETLRDAPGVGLAAPQVGKNIQIIVIEDKAKYHETVPKPLLKAQERKVVPLKVIVNPKIQILDDSKTVFFEGCLSAEGYVAVVERAKKVRLTGWDRNGKAVSIDGSGWLARIMQHEVDHLNGILLIDKMKSKSFMTIKNFNLLWRKAMPEKINKSFG